MADLENGLFSGVNAGYNANDPTINHRFVTAMVKGEPNHWAIRGGNAQSGGLTTYYDGPRPNGGLQPDEEGGRHHPRHRRRQQQRSGRAPSSRA